MQLVNVEQFLNVAFLIVLFAAAPSAAVLLTVIFPLTSIDSSLQSHNVDFRIVVLSLIWLLTLYDPLYSSFISTQFFVLNLDG